MLPKNWGEPMGAPAIFEKQIEIKLLVYSENTKFTVEPYAAIYRQQTFTLYQPGNARAKAWQNHFFF
ncbi:MAG: hypothetical protein P8X79_11615 [Reinekea sp.]